MDELTPLSKALAHGDGVLPFMIDQHIKRLGELGVSAEEASEALRQFAAACEDEADDD